MTFTRTLSKQAASILDLLATRGRVKNTTLAKVTPHYAARISDLRKAGYAIACVARSRAKGRTYYSLMDTLGGAQNALVNG